jgi:hypothetical protein
MARLHAGQVDGPAAGRAPSCFCRRRQLVVGSHPGSPPVAADAAGRRAHTPYESSPSDGHQEGRSTTRPRTSPVTSHGGAARAIRFKRARFRDGCSHYLEDAASVGAARSRRSALPWIGPYVVVTGQATTKLPSGQERALDGTVVPWPAASDPRIRTFNGRAAGYRRCGPLRGIPLLPPRARKKLPSGGDGDGGSSPRLLVPWCETWNS